MAKYSVIDSSGRIIELTEKTSWLLTLGMIVFILAAVGLFGFAALSINGDFTTSLILGFMGLTMLIYVFVLNHLRRKADMNVDQAGLPTASGGVILVKKISSIWITLALVFVYISIILTFIGLFYAVYLFINGIAESYALIGGSIGSLIVLFIYARILGFLRTRLDFDGERIVIPTQNGIYVELYKDRSFWITLALIITIIGAIILFAVGALAIIYGASILPVTPIYTSEGIGELTHAEITTSQNMSSMITGIGLFVIGILFLINAAVLNFLRIRTHIRPLEEMMYRRPTTQPTQM